MPAAPTKIPPNNITIFPKIMPVKAAVIPVNEFNKERQILENDLLKKILIESKKFLNF